MQFCYNYCFFLKKIVTCGVICVVMRRILSIILILFTTLSSADGAIKRIAAHDRIAISASRYEVIDIPFVAKERCATPFDVDLTAVFISPSGREQRITAFYNSHNEWVVRFSAAEVGEWSYTTSSEIRSLSGKKGTLTITDKRYNGRHGGLAISKNFPTKFAWEDGSPCFLLAYGCEFLYAMDYHNTEGAPNLNSFVDTIKAQGFNQITMAIYAYDKAFEQDSKLSKKPQYILGGDSSIFPFLGSNAEPNHSVLNINFFRRLDRIVERLNDLNIVAQLVIYNWDSGVNWAEQRSVEDNRFFNYVVRRYQAFSNVVWSVSSSLSGDISDDYIIDRCQRLRDNDTFGRLLTVGDDGFCQRKADQVDFISRRNRVLQSGREMVAKPTMSIDNGGYEQCGFDLKNALFVDAEQCLRRSYEVLFAGDYTTYYWQGSAWSLLIYDLESMPKGAVSPKMEYYNNLGRFFKSHPYGDFKPLSGVSDSSLCMGSSDGRTHLFYIPSQMHRLSAEGLWGKGQRFLFQWFNTITGEYSDVSVGVGSQEQTAPINPYYMSSDAVLIVKILE